MATPRREAGRSYSSGRLGLVVLGLVILATLMISSSYGIMLLLAPFVTENGGTEASYGVVTAVAAVPTAIVLGLLIKYPRRFRPHTLLAAASVLYGLAALGASTVDAFGPMLVVLGIVLGTAWAAAYTVAPMIVSELVDDIDRARYIGYVTGTIQVGFGIGPVLGGALLAVGIGYSTIFLLGGGLAAVAALLCIPLAARLPARTPSPAGGTGEEEAGDEAGDEALENTALGAALLSIARSPAVIPLVMILLSACLFTTMLSFQTTFALSRGLSYDYFYVAYSVAVVASRLLVAPMLRDSASDRVLSVCTIGVALSVVAFLAVGSSAVLYTIVSAVLGVTYGLALPAVQARSVNLAHERDKARLLPLAGWLYEVAILVFPLAAGAVIAGFGYVWVFIMLAAITLVVVVLGQVRTRRPAAPAVGTEPAGGAP